MGAQVTTKMIEELVASLKEATLALDGFAKGEGVFKPIEQTIVRCRAAIKAALSTDAEPVAYMHPNGAIWRLDNCPEGIDWQKDGWTPLYAALYAHHLECIHLWEVNQGPEGGVTAKCLKCGIGYGQGQGYAPKNLYENDAVWASFYRDGKTLGEICEEYKCGIYDLSPWLIAPLMREASKASKQERGND